MQTELIIIGSITYTMKAKNALHDIGIRATVKKLKARDRGCSYGIEFPSGQLLAVASTLRSLNIAYELYHT